jgi:ssDNA-binding Zn-finger/Zn-ribbon topoisomerase 1
VERIKKRNQEGYINPYRFNYDDVLEGKISIDNQYYNSHTMRIKKWMFDFGIKKYECEECGISEWNNKPIVLELDHIDGNRNNNILSNLKILCPNCHSQTDTFKGKNKNKLK